MKRRARSIAALGLLAALCSAAPAGAQSSLAHSDPKVARRSLRQRVGIDAVLPLLRAEPSAERRRAFERLGSIGTSRALEMLSLALASGGEARDARERLVVVRALAAHGEQETARTALIRALAGAGSRDDPKEALVQQSAALALARSGELRAVQALAQALRQPGAVSETARLGLRAHPPRDLTPLLAAPGTPTPALVDLLGELKAPRAAELLQRLAARGAPPVRARSLTALLQVDRARAVSAARRVVETEPMSEVFVAAARVLARTEDELAASALDALLRKPASRPAALALSLDFPHTSFGPVLARANVSGSETERLFAALARAGGDAALGRLERALGSEAHAWAAAYALALAGSDADEPLERALERPAQRRNALRAAALRHHARGRSLGGVGDALQALSRSSVPADRAAFAFAAVVLDADRAPALLASGDPAVVRAVARAALLPRVAVPAAERLARERDPGLQAALSVALASEAAADRVPDAALRPLLESFGAAAHLAAYALAARDRPGLRPRLRELLESSDPLLRAHVALGLARSSDSSVVGWLGDAYEFETDARVRRALVRALGRRAEPGRLRWLKHAAELDPDDGVRSAARGALGGRAEPDLALQTGTAWVRLGSVSSADQLLVLHTASGLALPFAPDADGSVTVAGLPGGNVGLGFAAAAPGL